jgi:hypothetical protein
MPEDKEPAGGVGRLRAEVAKRTAAAEVKSRRVWCAYNADGSCFVLFGQEVAAMRYALEHHLDGCRAVEFGVPLLDQIR